MGRDETHQALDDFVLDQLSGIDRTFNELTERLGDPDVLANPKLIMEVSQERASVEEVPTYIDSRAHQLEFDAAVYSVKWDRVQGGGVGRCCSM